MKKTFITESLVVYRFLVALYKTSSGIRISNLEEISHYCYNRRFIEILFFLNDDRRSRFFYIHNGTLRIKFAKYISPNSAEVIIFY